MNKIEVAVGVVAHPEQGIILTQRAKNAHQGGKWEFPGGKVEESESPAEALLRELGEEVGIMPLEYVLWREQRFSYPDRHVILYIYWVSKFSGIPYGAEEQTLAWVQPPQLGEYHMPDANQGFLPDLMAYAESALSHQVSFSASTSSSM
tara:strand:+ start:15649 stop:16095 length:447 start_codon:yes stop_codon:yes gene_type:complete